MTEHLATTLPACVALGHRPGPGLPAALPPTGVTEVVTTGWFHAQAPHDRFSRQILAYKSAMATPSVHDTGGAALAARVARTILDTGLYRDHTGLVAVPPKLGEAAGRYHLDQLLRSLVPALATSPAASLRPHGGALTFVRPTPAIKELALARRPAAMFGSVSCTIDVDGRRILLLDDIVASGATASACATALLERGAVSVTVVALAQRVC